MVYICIEAAMRDRLRELTPSAWKVLTCIALHMDADRKCWPSISLLVTESGMSRPVVVEAVKSLEAGGWIAVKRGAGGKSNTYRVKTELLHMNGSQVVKNLNRDGGEVVKNLYRGSKESELSSVKNLNSGSKESELEVDTIEVDTTEEDTKKKNTRSRELVFSADFAAFWAVYPRKDGKQSAWRRWQTRRREKVTAATMTAAAANYAAYCEAVGTESRYIKHGATFIGPDRHYEEWQEPRTAPKNGGKREIGREAEFDEAARLLGLEVAG